MHYKIPRKKTKQIQVGNVTIGGGAPIIVQSMTNTQTSDIEATVKQIHELKEVGCEIVRVAVPDTNAANAISEICSQANVPIIADIHFDYRLALKSIEGNVAGVRLNPGNIGSAKKTEAVIKAAKERGLPIRVGVNAGSVSKKLLKKHGGATVEAMVESALEHISIIEKYHYDNIKVSLKASDIHRTVEAYRQMSEKVEYPLHIGVSEAGTYFSGTVKSSIGLGILLYEGIGDTLRVSLTGDPLEEVRVAYEILKSLGIRQKGINYVSCPTCGRCEIDLVKMAEKVQKATAKLDKQITVAIMGCVVNGPGEAREANLGIAGGDGSALLFKDGEIIRKVGEEEMIEALIREIEAYK